jgi:hypothetical protein
MHAFSSIRISPELRYITISSWSEVMVRISGQIRSKTIAGGKGGSGFEFGSIKQGETH